MGSGSFWLRGRPRRADTLRVLPRYPGTLRSGHLGYFRGVLFLPDTLAVLELPTEAFLEKYSAHGHVGRPVSNIKIFSGLDISGTFFNCCRVRFMEENFLGSYGQFFDRLFHIL